MFWLAVVWSSLTTTHFQYHQSIFNPLATRNCWCGLVLLIICVRVTPAIISTGTHNVAIVTHFVIPDHLSALFTTSPYLINPLATLDIGLSLIGIRVTQQTKFWPPTCNVAIFNTIPLKIVSYIMCCRVWLWIIGAKKTWAHPSLTVWLHCTLGYFLSFLCWHVNDLHFILHTSRYIVVGVSAFIIRSHSKHVYTQKCMYISDVRLRV